MSTEPEIPNAETVAAMKVDQESMAIMENCVGDGLENESLWDR